MHGLAVSGTYCVTAGDAEKVRRFEHELAKQPQIYVEPAHGVHGLVYHRTGLIPAGTSFTGAVHKKDHINVVCGDITILTDEGPKRLTGYHVLPTKAGSKRVAYTHADTYWTTLAHTMLSDLTEIEDELAEDASNLQTRKYKEQASC